MGKQSKKAPGGGHIDIANNRPVIAAGEVKKKKKIGHPSLVNHPHP